MKAILFALLTLCSSLATAVNYVGILQVPAVPLLVVSVTGGGTVTSSPAGISCTSAGGAGCTAAWSNGTSVTLTATGVSSNATSTSYGTGTKNSLWSGIACTGQSIAGTCGLTFNGATTAAVTFSHYDSDVMWVSPSGSDSNNCRFIVSSGGDGPCLTVHHVSPLMSSGDTLYFDDGTYSGAVNSIGGFSGDSTTDIVQGTSRKYTRYIANNQNAAILDGKYQATPIYIFKRAYLEINGFIALHGLKGPLAVDGSRPTATGASLTPTYAAGALTAVPVGAAGTNYSTGTQNRLAIFGVTCDTYPEASFTLSGTGIASTSIVYGGTNCVELTGSGVSADMGAHDIRIINNGIAFADARSTNTANSVGSNRCANCLFANNFSWGYGSRYNLSMFAGAWNVARQNVLRYDGIVSPTSEPKACMVIYSEDYTIAENNLCVNFTSTPDSADDHSAFYMTSSASLPVYPYGMGTGSYLGNIAINVSGTGPGAYSMRIDNNSSMFSTPGGGVTPVITIKDNVLGVNTSAVNNTIAMGFTGDGLASSPYGAHHALVVDNNTIYDKTQNADTFGVALRFFSVGYTSITLTDTVIASPDAPTIACLRADQSITSSSNNLWWQCNNSEFTAVPNSVNVNPVFTWLERPGSAAPTKGATVDYQYVNGVLTGTSLWPFANEAAIKSWMCGGPDDAATPTVGGNALIAGNTYYVTVLGNTDWVAAGGANVLGTKFVAANTGNGTTGTATPNIFTRGHNATGWCAGVLSLTEYIWQQYNGTPYSAP